MAQGLVTGVFSGLVLSAAAFFVASPLLPEVSLAPRSPEAIPVSVPAGSAFNAELPDEPPLIPETDAVASGPASPLVVDTLEVLAPQVDTEPASLPTAGGVEVALAAPDPTPAPEVPLTSSASDGDQLRPEAEQPVAPVAEEAPGRTPVPDLDSDIVASDAPSSDAAPEVQTPSVEEPPLVLPEVVENPSLPVPDTSEAPSPEAVASAPAPEVIETPEPQPMTDVPDVTPAPEVAVLTPPSNFAAPSIEAPRPAAPAVEIAPVDKPDITAEPPAQAETAPEVEPEVEPAPEDVAEPDAEAAEEDPLAEPKAPIEAYAADFEPGSERPRLAVVLIDRGDTDLADLIDPALPYAVALDPSSKGTAERMRLLREQGREVMVLAPLIEEATPSDVEIAFESFLNSVPEAVAVMDTPNARLQDSRSRAAQVVEIVSGTGHGVVTYDKGLNALLQVASGAGVPAATVARVFDTGQSDNRRMKRFLDQGAFQAGQEGHVLLVGDLRPETLATLAEWVSGTRANSVELAPPSAVLLGR